MKWRNRAKVSVCPQWVVEPIVKKAQTHKSEKPGPEPDRLKIEGDWESAMGKSLKADPKAIPAQPGKGTMPQPAKKTKPKPKG